MVSTSEIDAVNVSYQKWNVPADLSIEDNPTKIKFKEEPPAVHVFPNFETVEELFCRSCDFGNAITGNIFAQSRAEIKQFLLRSACYAGMRQRQPLGHLFDSNDARLWRHLYQQALLCDDFDCGSTVPGQQGTERRASGGSLGKPLTGDDKRIQLLLDVVNACVTFCDPSKCSDQHEKEFLSTSGLDRRFALIEGDGPRARYHSDGSDSSTTAAAAVKKLGLDSYGYDSDLSICFLPSDYNRLWVKEDEDEWENMEAADEEDEESEDNWEEDEQKVQESHSEDATSNLRIKEVRSKEVSMMGANYIDPPHCLVVGDPQAEAATTAATKAAAAEEEKEEEEARPDDENAEAEGAQNPCHGGGGQGGGGGGYHRSLGHAWRGGGQWGGA